MNRIESTCSSAIWFFCVGMVLCGLLAVPVHGQYMTAVVGTVESPTSGGNAYPFNWAGGRYQHVFTGAEVGYSGRIVEVQATQNGGSLPQFNGFRLRLAQSNANPQALSQTFDSNASTPWHTGLGPVSHTPTSVTVGSYTYARFPLTTPFQYDASSGLVVDWSYDNKGAGGWSVPTAANSAGRQRLFSLNGTYQTVSGSTGSASRTTTTGAGQRLPGACTWVPSTLMRSADEVGASLNSITIEHVGTGNAETAFSEVSLYEAAGTTFNPAVDDLIDTFTSFPASGELTFALTSNQSFAPQDSRTYFLVVKLAGTATNGDTFDFEVSDIDVTGPDAIGTGVPSDTMEGLIIVQAALEVTALSGLPQAVWPDEEGPGGNGLHVVTFEIEEFEDLAGAELEGITIALTGTGNGQTAFSEVALYEAVGSSFDFTGTDIGGLAHGFPHRLQPA
jgi:hypothetical protein